MSDREIAEHVGVSEMTVGRYRASISNNVIDTTRTVTRNGSTYQMDGAPPSEIVH